ncbi:MAG TPA: hypothetical protein VIU29_01010 [Candidatus Deferrimicrobiaceae bacterium]
MQHPGGAPEERAIRRQAAAPNLLLAALHAVAGLWGLFKGRPDFARLYSIMAIEAFVIHSFPFMMLIGSCEPKTVFGKRARNAAFWSMLVVYLLFAWKEGGPGGAAAFAGLTVSTYLGYLLRRTGPEAVVELLARWTGSFLVFAGAMVATGIGGDIDAWRQSARLPVFGFLYFSALGLLELDGFYERPRVRQLATQLKSAFDNRVRS